jgi:multidrug resistance efflux pump
MPETKAPRKGSRRPLAVVLILLLALGAGAAFGHFRARLKKADPPALLLPLTARLDGTVLSLEAKPGDTVSRGKVLLRMDDTQARALLLEERRKLENLGRTLPAQDRIIPASDKTNGDETLARREERLRALEEEAVQRMQAASEGEAAAAVRYGRAQARNAPERAELEKALEAARKMAREAKREYETASRKRAEAGAEIKNAPPPAGQAGLVPLEVRRKAYAEQQEKVQAAERDLEDMLIRAPEKGVVHELLVKNGDWVRGGAVCLIFRSAAPAANDEQTQAK